MKKVISVFLVFSMFFLVWCEKNIQKTKIDNKETICNSNKNLWKNKFYNLSMCLPLDYFWYDGYWHPIPFDKKLNTFVVVDNEWKQYIMDDDITIGLLSDNIYNKISFWYWGCSSENKKLYNLWKIKVLDIFDDETNKYINTEYLFRINKKDICLSFNKNNKQHIKIINSIKPLTEK